MSTPRHLLPVPLLVGLCLAHCGGTQTTTTGSKDSGADRRVVSDAPVADAPPRQAPQNHRPDDSQCLTPPPPADCGGMTGGMGPGCHMDSDCTAGLNGRCAVGGQDGITCACTYDACTSDKQCTRGGPCSCHGSVDMGSTNNTCADGNCQVDADCEGGAGFCSPSDVGVGCGSLPNYYCHTPLDSCVNDSDCTSCGPGTQPCGCGYDASSKRWTCQPMLGCA